MDKLREENKRLLAKVIELQGRVIEAQLAHMKTIDKLTRIIVNMWREK